MPISHLSRKFYKHLQSLLLDEASGAGNIGVLQQYSSGLNKTSSRMTWFPGSAWKSNYLRSFASPGVKLEPGSKHLTALP